MRGDHGPAAVHREVVVQVEDSRVRGPTLKQVFFQNLLGLVRNFLVSRVRLRQDDENDVVKMCRRRHNVTRDAHQ